MNLQYYKLVTHILHVWHFLYFIPSILLTNCMIFVSSWSQTPNLSLCMNLVFTKNELKSLYNLIKKKRTYRHKLWHMLSQHTHMYTYKNEFYAIFFCQCTYGWSVELLLCPGHQFSNWSIPKGKLHFLRHHICSNW